MALIDMQTNLLNLRFPKPPNFNKVPNTEEKLEAMLVNGVTDFTNQQYSLDRPGGGYSGLPYIKTAIPNNPSTPYLNTSGTSAPGAPIFRTGTTGGLDYPIRGGQVNFQIGQQTFTLSGMVDKTRISRFFQDAPRGTAFIQKQIGLQLSNPKIETQTSLFGIGGGFTFPGLLENTRVYNKGINTLSQVLHSGTGAHAVRHGAVPFPLADRYYFYTVNQQNIENEKSTNRLVNLAVLKMTTGNSPFVNTQNALDLGTVNSLGISLNRSVMFDYLGGPGSTYGIGKTLIRRYQDTTQLGVTVKNFASRNAMVYDQIRDASNLNTNSDGTRGTQIKDFELARRESLSPNAREYYARLNALLDKEDKLRAVRLADVPASNRAAGRLYKKGDRLDTQIRLLESNPPPGASNSPVKTWTPNNTVESRFYEDGVDKLNSSLTYTIENSGDRDPWSYNTQDTDDLIKFGFEAISNDAPSLCQVILFRAFLTSTITDNHDGEWSNFRYQGRGEQFYTYQGFTRTIGFSFRIAALSDNEMKPMYNRLNALVSQVYPDYSRVNKMMRAPVVRLTIGDYIYRMPGVLDNVNISIDNSTPWDVNLGVKSNNIAQLPKILDVQVSFKPIHEYLPQRNKIGNFAAFEKRIGNSVTETSTTDLINVPLIANRGVIMSTPTTAVSVYNKVY